MDTAYDPQSFAAFVSSRCVAYVLSSDELGTLQAGFGSHGCNCYSAGEPLNIECILPRAWPHMLSWLDKAYNDPEYVERIVFPGSDVEDELSEAMEGLNVSSDGGDRVSGEDSEGRMAAGEEDTADQAEAGDLIQEVKRLEGQLKQEDVSQDVKPAATEDEVLATVKIEEVEV